MKIRKRIAFACLLAAATFFTSVEKAEAGVIRTGFDTSSLAANDDGSTGAVALGFSVNFFGATHSTAFLNNNGNLTFDSSLSAFTPFDLTSTSSQIIAPFFADVDTRGGGGLLTYSTGTVDLGGSIGVRDAFGVTWVDVGYFSSNIDKLNSFQAILIDRSDTGVDNFDIEFNYDKIQWEAGDFSGGSGGLGGSSARVGYSNGSGDAGSFFEFAGSAVNGAFLDSGPAGTSLIINSNVGVDGRYRFSSRGGSIGAVPEPTSLAIFGTICLVACGRRRKS